VGCFSPHRGGCFPPQYGVFFHHTMMVCFSPAALCRYREYVCFYTPL